MAIETYVLSLSLLEDKWAQRFHVIAENLFFSFYYNYFHWKQTNTNRRPLASELNGLRRGKLLSCFISIRVWLGSGGCAGTYQTYTGTTTTKIAYIYMIPYTNNVLNRLLTPNFEVRSKRRWAWYVPLILLCIFNYHSQNLPYFR